MTSSWFNTPERIAALEAAVTPWLRTPWRLNSAVPGLRGGVSCHHLAAELYFASGYFERFQLPIATIRALVLGLGPSLAQLFPPAIAARFVAVPDFLSSPLLPGDLILIRETTNAIHLGVVLANRRFAHVLRASGVQISSLDDPTYGTRLTEVLRPLSDS